MADTACGIVEQPVGRLNYLDWLRILALGGVFVFHTMRPFDESYWHVKNADVSLGISVLLNVMGSWGLAFFFLVAGAGTALALRWRTTGQFLGERLIRLLVPLVVAYLLLGPVQFFLEDHNHGTYNGSFLEDTARFFSLPPSGPPLLLPNAYHLWFVVLLLEFSLVGLPLFAWLRRPSGQRVVGWLARRAERSRTFLLLMIAPVMVLHVALGAAPGAEHGWSEFLFYLDFFLLGHLLMTDARFMDAVRRAMWPALGLGLVSLSLAGVTGVGDFLDRWWDSPSYSLAYVWFFALITTNAWGWILATLSLGVRARAFRRSLPRPVAASAMPFFLVHQPVILAVAFVVVQWDAGIAPKLAAVFAGSLVISSVLAWGLSRTPAVSVLFGVKRVSAAPTTVERTGAAIARR